MNADKVAVIVQSRMSSTRLPGKALAPLAGEAAIFRMMERVRRVVRAAHHIVATSVDSSDDPLADVCRNHGIRCVRGPLDDVLGRIAAAVPKGCEVVVRLTGDCPLVDPVLVDYHVERFVAEENPRSYVSNALVRTYPDGLDVEVMSRDMLMEADREATDPFDREHVTPWIQRHAGLVPVTQDVDLSVLRWTLDTPADYAFLSTIYALLYPVSSSFDSRAIYQLLVDRPELVRVAEGNPSSEAVRRMRAMLAQETPA
jgi:spore coat polysaccharide biosynthesis protein SpsF